MDEQLLTNSTVVTQSTQQFGPVILLLREVSPTLLGLTSKLKSLFWKLYQWLLKVYNSLVQ